MPSRLSTEYWKVPVTGTADGQPIDVSTDLVYMAVLGSAAVPADTDWHPAAWEPLGGGKYAARLLVGPAGGVLDFSTAVTGPTRMYVWVKVGDNPETPIINAGAMLVS